MALTDFFKVNLPYGIERRGKKWYAFNREYMPLGYHTKSRTMLTEEELDIVSTEYSGLTDKFILTYIDPDATLDEEGKVVKAWLYKESIHPAKHPELWEEYINKLKKLFDRQVKRKD